METHRIVEKALSTATIESPSHAGQRGEERTVAHQPALRAQLRRKILQVWQLLRQMRKEAFQDGGLDQVLGFRKTAEADPRHPEFLAYFRQSTGLDNPAHRAG